MPLSSSVTAEKTSPLEHSHGRVHLIGGDFYYSPNSQRDVQLPLVYNDIPFRNCFKDRFAEFHGGNLPAPTSPSYLFDRVLLEYPSRTFSISHIFLAFAMEVSPLCMIFYSSLASTIGCPLIPGGRYTHLAWLRTASDTVSCLGTDP